MADVWANSMAYHQEPRITLQGAATWWIHRHNFRATCHIAGCSHLAKSMSWLCHIAGCNNSIRHIENRFSPYFIFLFLMQFRLWRAAAFVSSPIHLLNKGLTGGNLINNEALNSILNLSSVTSLMLRRHWCCDVTDAATSLMLWRHWCCDVTDAVLVSLSVSARWPTTCIRSALNGTRSVTSAAQFSRCWRKTRNNCVGNQAKNVADQLL